mmetsp:Transcript_23431/g.42287  ORF Transcript_23431/g.42287 Transcript_23431/m.42287 type:complete len:188 (+) Transcript_23431:50-613(+)
MGACCSGQEATEPQASQAYNTKSRVAPKPQGAGHVLGGEAVGVAATKERALQAALARQAQMPGVSPERAAQLFEQQRRAGLLAKLTEYYQKRGQEMPMALQLASCDQLQKHWASLAQPDVAAAVVRNTRAVVLQTLPVTVFQAPQAVWPTPQPLLQPAQAHQPAQPLLSYYPIQSTMMPLASHPQST